MQQITMLTSDFSQKVTVEMTTEEYLAFVQSKQRRERRTLKGLAGIRELFLCGKSKAFKISHEEWFQPAKLTFTRNFIFDADLAWELAHNQNNKPAA